MNCRKNTNGLTLIELMIAMAILSVASLSLVTAFATSANQSLESDRALAVQASLQTTYESLADVAFDQLLSWNGVSTRHGDHDVSCTANLVEVGLIEVDFTVTDRRTGEVLARMATYRSGEY